MLQIIGWLGCVYLLVKSLEIFSSSNFRTEAGKLKESAMIAALIAFWGAVGFAIWFSSQGAGMPQPSNSVSAATPVPETPEESMSQGKIECITKAKTTEETLACK